MKLLDYFIEYEDKIQSVVVKDRDVVETMSRFLGKIIFKNSTFDIKLNFLKTT